MIFGILFLILAGIVLVVILLSPNTYKAQRDFEQYFRVTLAEGSRNLPIKGFNIGPKTVWISYDEQESEVIYVGRNGDPAWSYTEVYFADGGRFLGYYQRISTGSYYGDGFTPELLEYTEITRDEFLQHVPATPALDTARN